MAAIFHREMRQESYAITYVFNDLRKVFMWVKESPGHLKHSNQGLLIYDLQTYIFLNT